MSERVPTLPPKGTFAGKYQLLRKLAQGGMGAVYAARDDSAARDVAIKVLIPELALDPELHRRFRREASVLNALDHPNVVRVLDFGTDQLGRAYTVMELLEGETLRARLERLPRPTFDELQAIILEVCAGLAAVHEHGVLHGDVKPENVILSEGVGTKLVDFGLSKIYGLDRLTRTGEILGTPVYMAPELLTGRGEIDETIDTYAIGVMLYEALAGRPPFAARNAGALLMQIAHGRCDDLAAVSPNVPSALSDVVARAMSVDRAKRYSTARALADALTAVRWD